MSQSQTRKVGNFEVVREIAEGGMGVVYLARQPALDRSVVLKKIRRELIDDRSVLELIDADYSFLNERLASFYDIDGVDQVRTGIGSSGFHFLKLVAKGKQAAIRMLFFDFSDCASGPADPSCDSPFLPLSDGFSVGPLNVFTSGIDLRAMGNGDKKTDVDLMVALNLDSVGGGLWRLFFGLSNGECSGASDIDVKRVDDITWEIEATQEDIACLMGNTTHQGGNSTFRGLYHMPFKLTLTVTN